MPIYEYTCKDCGLRFDAIRPIKDADAPITCKKCLGSETQRALSVFFTHSGERGVARPSNSSCAGCSSGSCASCGH